MSTDPAINPESLAPWGTHAPSALVQKLRAFAASRSQSYWDKRMAYAARKLALAQIQGPVDVEVFGYKLRVEPTKNLAEKRILFTPQYFDPQERDFLKRVLPMDGIFVDIGANAGAYSFFAASCMRATARILAIDPQPEVFARLVANVAFNPGVPIEPIDEAVADVDGPIQLFVDANNAGETGMRRVRGHALDGGTVEVRGRPLLDILSERDLPRVDALKIDIEGAEDLALVPFFRDAPEQLWPTLLILENSPESWQTNCITLAQSKGYQLVAEARLNVVMTRV